MLMDATDYVLVTKITSYHQDQVQQRERVS